MIKRRWAKEVVPRRKQTLKLEKTVAQISLLLKWHSFNINSLPGCCCNMRSHVDAVGRSILAISVEYHYGNMLISFETCPV